LGDNTGGVGEDRVAGYSLIDLDLLVRATDTGLLDIVLDHVLSSSCTVHFPVTNFSASATFDLEVRGNSHTFSESLTPTAL